jgi:hypothetical protein
MLIASQVEPHLFRHRSELLLAEIQRRLDIQGHHHVDTRIRVLERLKGAADRKIRENREISDLSGIGGDSTRLLAGTPLIFFGGRGRLSEMRIDPGYACPILLATPQITNKSRHTAIPGT